jgi:predicted dehydrogenase
MTWPPLRVGILGFGGAGQAHAFYVSCVPGCRVVKVFDPEPERLARAALSAPQAVRCGGLDEFWPDLDAVIVCTPDRTHAGYIVDALGHGLHVLCEKPLTDSMDGIRRISAAEAASNRVVAVVHQMRFVPLHQKIRAAIDAGVLGAIFYMEGYYAHNLTTRAFQNDTWRRTDNATPLVYSGCHFVDLLRWFAGEEIVEVLGAANNIAFPAYPESDLNVVLMRFASGAIGKVVVTFGEPAPQDHTVRVSGAKGSVQNALLFTNEHRWGTVLHRPIVIQRPLLKGPGKEGGQTLYRQLRTNLPPYIVARMFDGLRFGARRPGAEYGVRYYPLRLYEHSLACVNAIHDFVTAIRERRRPLCTVEESARTVLACLAGVESYRTNRPVAVPRLTDVLAAGVAVTR